jgi:hypothetical protein
MSRTGSVALVALLLLAGAAPAADPLRHIPGSAQAVIKIENPRKLAEAITGLAAVQDAKELAPVRELLETTAARRGFQMLAYVEKELGAKWPELLDQLAGDGIALGIRFGDKAPAILVLEGTDEEQTGKALDLLLQIVQDELNRQGIPVQPVRDTYRGAETLRFGNDVHLARTGATVLISNKKDFLHAALDHPGSGVRSKESLRAAEKLLPKDPLAWLWVDFASVKQSQATKDFFAATRKDFLQTLVAGSTIDCLRRSEFIAAGLYREAHGFRLALRLPAGRSEFPPDFALHTPASGKPGSLPLLEPSGVVYSQSFYLDLGFYWKHRDTFINAEMLKQLEQGEKQVSRFLPGSVSLGELLEMWGPHHRLVVVNHDTMPYKTMPSQRLPGFGYVATMHDPKFGKSLAAAIRSGALIASFQFGLKLVEVDHDGVKIVSYRFPEDRPLAQDPGGLRFNFEPCFAVVEDQFIAASTVEVCKKLIAEVKRTAKEPPSPAVWRGRGHADSGSALLYALPDPFVTDAILSGGVGLDEARKRIDAIGEWLKGLGTVRIELDEKETEYRFDVVWTHGK